MSFAVGTDGIHQVDFGSSGTQDHAILWSGSAASAVDLSPTNLSGFVPTYAYGVGGNEQVGWGSDGQNHALLWRGSPDSAVDLNPAGSTASYAWATNGSQQAGEMYPGADPSTRSCGMAPPTRPWTSCNFSRPAGRTPPHIASTPPGTSSEWLKTRRASGTRSSGKCPSPQLFPSLDWQFWLSQGSGASAARDRRPIDQRINHRSHAAT